MTSKQVKLILASDNSTVMTINVPEWIGQINVGDHIVDEGVPPYKLVKKTFHFDAGGTFKEIALLVEYA